MIQNYDGRGNGIERKAAPQAAECSWCGQPAKFTYTALHNDKPMRAFAPTYSGKVFCSKSCLRDYSR